MNVKSIFINLPITNLEQTRAFWSDLGFRFNEQFSDDKALCLILNEGSMYAMLITQPMFATFTNKPIANGSTTQAIFAIEVNTREEVDHMVATALSNGATRFKESVNHGWMYYDSFADLDGHQWEIMHTNPNFTGE